MTTRLRRFAFAFAPVVLLLASSPSSAEGPESFFGHYCVRCHGPEKPKGDFALHELGATIERGEKLHQWKRVLDKIESGAMPPRSSKQPTPTERRDVALALEKGLRAAGVMLDLSKRVHPSRGNWVDHDSLFSGKGERRTSTPGRLWRLTGQAYEEFIQGLNVKYRLGFRTYGHHKVRSPWELAPNSGFRDYASQHRIGEPEIEHHLRNATRVARAMIARLPKRGGIPELKKILEVGRSATSAQLEAAASSAFEGILDRQATATDAKRYAGFLASSLKRLDADKAVEQLLVALLFRPEILYRIEKPRDEKQRAMMPARELARSISYALTDREPDKALRDATERGDLARPEGVRAQVVRILEDRTIDKPRLLRFFQEYFGYTTAIDVFKDDSTRKAAGFRGKNDWHPNFFVSDADRLVLWVLDRDHEVLRELLTTRMTFTLTGDTKQAKGVKKNTSKPFSLFAKTALDIYEIDIARKEWSDERPFAMPKGHRMGLLTHPSWLIAHSTNFDNHAIHRGRWIRERLLGGRIPEIPVTVDATLPDEPDKPLRHRMRVTREAYCWKCHQEMDPLGLPFEQFDHFGRFRTKELGATVDTSGAVQRSGETKLDGSVKNPFELLERLAKSKRVEQVFVRHAFRYFLGRNETLADGPTLVAAHRMYRESGGSMNALVVSLLTSDAFLYRTGAKVTNSDKQSSPRGKP